MGMEGDYRVYRRTIDAEESRKRDDEQRAQEYLDKKELNTNRREFISRLGAAATIIGVPGVLGEAADYEIAEDEKAAGLHHHHHDPHRIAEEIEASPGAETFQMGELANMHVGGLETDFLGVHSGKLPETLKIDYSKNLERMWQKKVDIWTPRLAKRGKKLDINVVEMMNERTMAYANHWNGPSRGEDIHRTTLRKVTGEINKMVDTMISTIDAPSLAKLYHLSPEQLPVVGRLAVGIDSKQIDAEGMLAAYSMTELLPKWDGAANARIYDFLLQTGGKEFLGNIPSLGDPATSFGPLQFTAEALEDSIDPHTGKHERHGASVANVLLPEQMRLPNSLNHMHDFIEHFKAGYLFALNNLAVYTRRIHDPETLHRLSKIDKVTLLAFLSASHNNPSLARRALDMYLAVDGGRFGAPGFVLACTKVDDKHAADLVLSGRHYNALVRIDEYAQKTIANFKGLQDYLTA